METIPTSVSESEHNVEEVSVVPPQESQQNNSTNNEKEEQQKIFLNRVQMFELLENTAVKRDMLGNAKALEFEVQTIQSQLNKIDKRRSKKNQHAEKDTQDENNSKRSKTNERAAPPSLEAAFLNKTVSRPDSLISKLIRENTEKIRNLAETANDTISSTAATTTNESSEKSMEKDDDDQLEFQLLYGQSTEEMSKTKATKHSKLNSVDEENRSAERKIKSKQQNNSDKTTTAKVKALGHMNKHLEDDVNENDFEEEDSKCLRNVTNQNMASLTDEFLTKQEGGILPLSDDEDENDPDEEDDDDVNSLDSFVVQSENEDDEPEDFVVTSDIEAPSKHEQTTSKTNKNDKDAKKESQQHQTQKKSEDVQTSETPEVLSSSSKSFKQFLDKLRYWMQFQIFKKLVPNYESDLRTKVPAEKFESFFGTQNIVRKLSQCLLKNVANYVANSSFSGNLFQHTNRKKVLDLMCDTSLVSLFVRIKQNTTTNATTSNKSSQTNHTKSNNNGFSEEEIFLLSQEGAISKTKPAKGAFYRIEIHQIDKATPTKRKRPVVFYEAKEWADFFTFLSHLFRMEQRIRLMVFSRLETVEKTKKFQQLKNFQQKMEYVLTTDLQSEILAYMSLLTRYFFEFIRDPAFKQTFIKGIDEISWKLPTNSDIEFRKGIAYGTSQTNATASVELLPEFPGENYKLKENVFQSSSSTATEIDDLTTTPKKKQKV